MDKIEESFWEILSINKNNKKKILEILNSNIILLKIFKRYQVYIWSKLEPLFGSTYSEDSKFIRNIIYQIISSGKENVEIFLNKDNSSRFLKDISKFTVVYEIEKKLFEEKSNFQIVQVFKTKNFGNMLVIDNDVQLTESDEKNYHEMIAHVPINYFNRDINVLIIGGGDGGTAREVLKHNNVKNLTMIEIDAAVIKACKLYFPDFKPVFDNPRLNLIIGDGFEYVKNYNGKKFDVIIIDSTDFNQSEPLFTKEFYMNLKKIVNEKDYLICFNEDNVNWNENNIKRMVKEQTKLFNYVYPYIVYIPTFAGGLYSFCLVSDIINPIEYLIDWEYYKNKNLKLEYYTHKIHTCSFNLPKSLERKINKYRNSIDKNKTKGIHFLIDYYNIPFEKLEDKDKLINIFEEAIKISELTVIDKKIHKFEPQGLTGIYLLSESHLSFHTWPESEQLSIDLYSCSNFEITKKGIDYILENFKE